MSKLPKKGQGRILPKRKSSAAIMLSSVSERLSDQFCLIENMVVAAYIIDSSGAILKYNRAACKMWGRKPKMKIDHWHCAHRMLDANHQEVAKGTCFAARAIQSKKKVEGFEGFFEDHKGNRVPFLGYCTPILDGRKKVEGAITVLVDITQQKQIESELLETKLRLNKAQSISGIGSWEMWGKFNEQFWSDEFYRIHGLEPQSVKPSTKLRLSMVHRADRAKLQKAIDQAIRNNKPFSIEKRIVLPNKEIRWVLSQGEVQIDPLTNHRKISGTILDITDRKMVEMQKEDFHRRLLRTQSIAHIATWEMVGDEEIYWSDEFYKIHGLTPGSVKPSTKLRLSMVHPDDRKKLKDAITQAVSKKKPYIIEKRIILPDGSIRHVLSQGEVTVDLITSKQKLFGTLFDITELRKTQYEQKLKDIQLQEQVSKLEAERNKYSTLVNTISGIVWEADPVTFNFTYVSPQAETILGYPVQDWLASPTFWPNHIHPDDREKAISFCQSESAQLRNYEFEYRMISKTGEEIWMQDKVTVIHENGRAKLLRGIMLDITEKKQFIKALLETDHLFSRLSSNIPGIVFRLTSNQSIPEVQYASNTTEALLGISNQEFCANIRNLENLMVESDRSEFDHSLQAAIRNKKSWVTEFRVSTIKDNITWIAVQANVYEEEHGHFYWYGYMHDVTEIKRATQNLKLTRFTINHSADAVYWIRSDGTFHDFNNVAHQSLGYTREEFFQLDVWNVALFHQREAWEQHWHQLTIGKSLLFESAQKRKDGSLVEVEIHSNLIRYEDQEFNCAFVRDISDRKKMEAQLRISEARLQNTLDNMISGVVVVDANGEITYANRSAAAILHIRQHDISGRHFSSTDWRQINLDGTPFPPDKLPLAIALTQQVPTDNIRHGIVDKDGNKIWLSVNGAPLMDEEGNLYGAVSSFIDITQSVNDHQLLNQSEGELKAILNASTEVIIFLDKAGIIRSFNRAAAQAVSKLYNIDLITGVHAKKMVPENLLNLFQERLEEALHGHVVSDEGEIRFPNGEKYYARYRYLPVLGAKQEILGVSLTATDLTKERESEAERNRVASQLLYAAKLARLGSWELDLETMTGSWSEEVSKIHETSDLVIQFDKAINYYTPESKDRLVKLVNESMLTGESFDAEFQIQTEKGNLKWVRVVALCEQENEKPARLYGLIQDIDQIKNREQELARLAMIARRTDNLVVITDANRKIEWVNEAFERLTGYSLSEVVGKNPGQFLQGPESEKITVEKVRNALQNKESVHFEIINYSKQGRKYWLDIEIQPIFNAEGLLTNFMAIETDITDRKHTELLLRKQAREIQEKNDQFKLLSENIPNTAIGQMVYTFEGKRRFRYMSKGLEKILGIKVEDLVADPQTFYSLTHPDDVGKLMLAEEKSAKDSSYMDCQFRVFDKGGNLHWVHLKAMPRLIDDGILYDGVILDETEKVKAEEELNSHYKQLTELNSRLQMAYQAGNFGVWQLDTTTFILDADKRCFEIIRSAKIRNDKLFNYWASHIHLEDSDRVIRSMERSIRENSDYHEVYRWISDQGDILYLEAFGISRENQMIGIISDVTDRHVSQQRITDSEQQMRAVTENLPRVAIYQFVIDTSGNGRYKFISSVIEQITGLTPAEILQNPDLFNSYVHPDDWKLKQKKILEANTSLTVFEFEYRFKTKSGRWIWLRTRSNPHRSKDGSIQWNGVIIDINDHKLFEQKLIESEHRFRSLANSAPVMIWMSGVDKQCDYFNDVWLNFTGRTLEQELGNGWVEQVHPDDLDRCLKIYTESFDARTDFEMEYRLMRYDGVYRWIVDRGVPRYLPDGMFIGYIGSCFDIHESKENARLLVESESRFKLGAKVAKMGVYEWDVLTNKTFFDETARMVFGMIDTPEDKIFTEWLAGLSDKYREQVEQAMLQTVNNGEPHELIYEWRSKTGNIKVIHVNAIAKLDDSGMTRSIMGVATDITEEHHTSELLRESEQRFRLLADIAPVFIWMADEDKMHIYFNKAYLDFRGRTLGQESGYGWSDGIHPEDLERVTEVYETAFDNRESYRMEYRLMRNDGQYRWILSTAVPRYLNDKTFIGFIGSGIDITHQKRIEQDLKASNQEKEMLIKEIHHRVKNNLQLISSIIFVRRSKMEKGEVREFLDETRQKIRSIALIHERLLQKGSVHDIDSQDYLGKMILDMQLSQSPELSDKKIQYDITIESHTMKLDTAIYCGLIINEAVTNCLKHAFVGRDFGKISISLNRKINDRYELIVADDGVSLPTNIDLGQTRSFGMELLNIFIKQLGGKGSFERNNGTRLTVEFNM